MSQKLSNDILFFIMDALIAKLDFQTANKLANCSPLLGAYYYSKCEKYKKIVERLEKGRYRCKDYYSCADKITKCDKNFLFKDWPEIKSIKNDVVMPYFIYDFGNKNVIEFDSTWYLFDILENIVVLGKNITKIVICQNVCPKIYYKQYFIKGTNYINITPFKCGLHGFYINRSLLRIEITADSIDSVFGKVLVYNKKYVDNLINYQPFDINHPHSNEIYLKFKYFKIRSIYPAYGFV